MGGGAVEKSQMPLVSATGWLRQAGQLTAVVDVQGSPVAVEENVVLQRGLGG